MIPIKKTEKKFPIKVFSLIFSFVILLAAVFSRYSAAWFSHNDEINGKGLSFVVNKASDARIEHIAILKRTGSDVGAKMVYDSDNPSGRVEMTEYDTIWPELNVNTPLVLRITVSTTAAVPPGTIEINMSCPENHWKSGDKIQTYFSNVIGFRCCGFSDLDSRVLSNDTDAEYVYSEVIQRFSSEEPASFVTFSGGSPNAAYNNTVKGAHITLDVTSFEIKNERIVLYMEIDYVNDLAIAYITQNGIDVTASSDVAGGDFVTFPYDLNEITFDFR